MADTKREYDAEVIALQVLGWIIDDPSRASRFLDLSGLDPDFIRRFPSGPQVRSAAFSFLSGYEPDLVACARSLEIEPSRLADYCRSNTE